MPPRKKTPIKASGPAQPKKKPGKALEELVAWIETSLRADANTTVEHDVFLPDKDGGGPRQIDVLIRVKSGHDELLTIIEVRDRGKRADVRFVEEMSAKRVSVRADAACLVSKAGFSEAAIAKARALNVRLLTLAEATAGNWAEWCLVRHIDVAQREWEVLSMVCARPYEDTVIELADSVSAEDWSVPVITNQAGELVTSLRSLAFGIITNHLDLLFANVAQDGTRSTTGIIVREMSPIPLYILGKGDVREPIGLVQIQLEVWWSVRGYPLTLTSYERVDPDQPKALLDVLQAQVESYGRTMLIRLGFEPDGPVVRAGSRVVGTAQLLGEPSSTDSST